MMENEILNVLHNSQSVQLISLLAGALFFAAMGIRELGSERYEGLLYITIAFFFGLAHSFFFYDLINAGQLGLSGFEAHLWHWLIAYVSPALIVMFLAFGLWALAISERQAGLVKLFFGLTLLCYLFMLGPHWPLDLRGIITMIFGATWVGLELETSATA